MVKNYSLYLVVSEEYGKGRSALEIAESAIEGWVDIIQMREKNKPKEKLVKAGKDLATLCRKTNVTFIVNDDPVLAKEVDSDGVHLGQEDMVKYPINEARKIIGRDKIIGVSTHSVEQFKTANGEDVDYIAYGPIFPTKTKDYFLGTADIKNVVRIAKKPVFFIGGITTSNVDEILREGAKNIALIRDIAGAEDIESKTKEFKEKMRLSPNGTVPILSVKINGKDETINKGINIIELLSNKDITPGSVTIEHNLRIVPRNEWPRILLKDGDSVEIVRFMGGG